MATESTEASFFWRGPKERVKEWRKLGASEQLLRAVQYGVLNFPSKHIRKHRGGARCYSSIREEYLV